MRWYSLVAIYFLFWAFSVFFVLPFGVKTADEAGVERVVRSEPEHRDRAVDSGLGARVRLLLRVAKAGHPRVRGRVGEERRRGRCEDGHHPQSDHQRLSPVLPQ